MPETDIYVFREAEGEAPLIEWLDELKSANRRAHRKCLQRILVLSRLGSELRRPLADVLRDGIRELRARIGTVEYRILYFFHGANVVCLSHGIRKDGAVPPAEIDLAVLRRKLVERDWERYTERFEV
jgi:hypothetical protein